MSAQVDRLTIDIKHAERPEIGEESPALWLLANIARRLSGSLQHLSLSNFQFSDFLPEGSARMLVSFPLQLALKRSCSYL